MYEDSDLSISDYKVTSAWHILFRDESDKSWENQLNCYAWLYRKAGFKVEKLRIIAILRDWQKKKAQEDATYPQNPIVVIDIPLWTIEQQSAFVMQQVMLHISVEPLTDDELPVCTEDERWADKTRFAVYRNENKTATRVFDSYEQAAALVKEKSTAKDVYRIEERKGIDKRCVDYCSVNKFCSYYKSKYASVERVAQPTEA